MNEFLSCAYSECLGLITIKNNEDLPTQGVSFLAKQVEFMNCSGMSTSRMVFNYVRDR